MLSVSPWLVLAGLGAFHGLNPAMGWLFAVALGLHRKSRSIVLLSMIPIALGHLVSIGVVAALVVALGLVVDQRLLEIAAGMVLLGWAAYFAAYGHRHRVRVGMTTGMLGLGVWSFLMATAHGAGLMLTPALMSLCLAATPAAGVDGRGIDAGVAGRDRRAHGGHARGDAAIAVCVYEWLGLSFLRRGWINFDFIWIAALAITGIILIV